MTTYLVEFIPGNVPSSKNGKIWTGRYLVWSKAAIKYKKDTAVHWKALAVKIKQNEEVFNKTGKPLTVEFQFVRGTKHKFDYVNPLQTVLDLMVEFGCIEDDNADEVIPVFKPYKYDPKKPGVYVIIHLVNPLNY